MAYQTLNPYTGEVLKKFDYITDAELEQKLQQSEKPSRSGPVPLLHNGLLWYARQQLSWKNARKNWPGSILLKPGN